MGGGGETSRQILRVEEAQQFRKRIRGGICDVRQHVMTRSPLMLALSSDVCKLISVTNILILTVGIFPRFSPSVRPSVDACRRCWFSHDRHKQTRQGIFESFVTVVASSHVRLQHRRQASKSDTPLCRDRALKIQ